VPQLEGFNLILEEMAAADSTELWRIDLRKISVVDRNLFRLPALFRSYCEHCFLILYKGAKTSLVAKTKLEQPTTGGRLLVFQDILRQSLEITPVCDSLKAQAKMALLFLDPQADQHQLLEAFKSEPDTVRALPKDFAPMEPITFGIQMVSEDQQQFNQCFFYDFLTGIKFLLAADVESDHAFVSAATTWWKWCISCTANRPENGLHLNTHCS